MLRVCWLRLVSSSLYEDQTCCKLIFADLLQVVQTLSLWIKSLDNQVASNLLTTCSRHVIIKPGEQVMRTHSDITLMTTRQLAAADLQT